MMSKMVSVWALAAALSAGIAVNALANNSWMGGTVQAYDQASGKIVIKTPNSTGTWTLAKNVKISDGTKPENRSAIRVGDRVAVLVLTSGVITELRITEGRLGPTGTAAARRPATGQPAAAASGSPANKGQIVGKVTAVNPNNRSFTIRRDDNQKIGNFAPQPATLQVFRGGKRVGFSELKVGMTVHTYAGQGHLEKIEIE